MTSAPVAHKDQIRPTMTLRRFTASGFGGWGRRWLPEIELNLWRCFRTGCGGEIRLLFETQRPGIEHFRERFDRRVVRLHCFIETAALHTDPIFRAFQLRLQTQ